ncbi:hypothetical protein BO71DRAFT_473565 [Aspergillus ellipticus CBS 707.79]|uniref:Helicase C-terminal domain-containing protein n=1 Tax=Aspergillus ellipticus CBS 707.79 TaxID=1448320 RepID=A0A319DE44_9EURO|nr:hypothetical protein BO71DRAFT_473565 [Aspergillus ellipticus CBS 707.79]
MELIPQLEKDGKINIATLRRLSLLAFTPKLLLLADYLSTDRTLSAQVNKWVARKDKGLFFYHQKTRDVVSRGDLLPQDPLRRAIYLMIGCPKLHLLLMLFQEEGLFNPDPAQRPRFILFAQWPLVLWVVEMFLFSLGINYAVIRPNTTTDDRNAIIAKFNSPQSNLTVLLTVYGCAALDLNLHGSCSRAVVLEPARNYSSLFQVIGRVHRLGQTKAQRVWIFFSPGTISRWLEYHSVNQGIPQIAADIRNQAAEHVKETDDATIGMPDTELNSIRELAAKELREMLGIEGWRHHVGQDLHNLHATGISDAEPEEVSFPEWTPLAMTASSFFEPLRLTPTPARAVRQDDDTEDSLAGSTDDDEDDEHIRSKEESLLPEDGRLATDRGTSSEPLSHSSTRLLCFTSPSPEGRSATLPSEPVPAASTAASPAIDLASYKRKADDAVLGPCQFKRTREGSD